MWEVAVDGDDESSLRLIASTKSDDSKVALAEVLAARSHEALQREAEAEALGADLELLMERARKVWFCWCWFWFCVGGVYVVICCWCCHFDLLCVCMCV
jgi:hypothetical protein